MRTAILLTTGRSIALAEPSTLVLLDVNVLIYAHRRESPRHAEYTRWMLDLRNSTQRYGVPEPVVSGFVRIVTNAVIFAPASTIDEAFDFLSAVDRAPVLPTAAHRTLLRQMCSDGSVTPKAVSDAYLAALAIDLDAELVTADRGFARFPGLRWRHPLD